MVNTSVRNENAIKSLCAYSYRVAFLPFVSKANGDYTTYIKVVCPLVSKADGRIALVYLELECPNRTGDKGVN